MADRIEINFTANVREVTRGTEQIREDLGSIESAISEVERGGKDLAAELIKNFLDTARAAGKSADEIERVLVQSYAVPAEAAKKMARISTSELGRVERAVADVGKSADELEKTVTTRTAGGFDDLATSAEDSLDGIGTSLLGIAGIAGGVGGAVATALGTGIQFVTDLITTQQEEAATLRDNLVGAYVDAGAASRLYLEDAQITAAANEIIADDAQRNAARVAAAIIGVDVVTYIRAQAGSYTDLQTVIAATAVAEETRGQVTEDQSRAGQAAALQEAAAIDAVRNQVERLQEAHDEGRLAAELAAENQKRGSEEAVTAIETQRTTLQALRDDIGTGVPVRVTLDDEDLQTKLGKSRTLRVQVEGYSRTGQRVI